MATLSTKRRHSFYEEWEKTAAFLWPSYQGGRTYHEAGMLDRYPRETNIVHAARQERAYLLNFFAVTVDAYVSAVFRRDPVREPLQESLQEPLQESLQEPLVESQAAVGIGQETSAQLSAGFAAFVEDTTGTGTPLNDFSREVAVFALAAERAFVGVDINEAGRPYAYMIHPTNLLDFSEERDGTLSWAIVAEERAEDRDPYIDRKEYRYHRLWTPDETVLFNSQGSEIDRKRNSAGRVPIIAVPGVVVGFPAYDAALVNKRIYNLCSQLDEILVNVTFPQFYYQGEGGVEDETGDAISPDVSPIVLSTARALEVSMDSSMAPGFLAPPDGPAKLHMEERDRLVAAIYSLAGLERKDPDSQTPQSGVAKAYDFRETNERFVALAQVIENFERELFGLLSDYGVAGEVNVTYSKDFNVRDFTAMLDNFLKIAGAPLPDEAKKRAALEVSMYIAEEAEEEEKKLIREAVENMPSFDAGPPGIDQLLRGALG